MTDIKRNGEDVRILEVVEIVSVQYYLVDIQHQNILKCYILLLKTDLKYNLSNVELSYLVFLKNI